MVATLGHRHLIARAAHDHHVLDRRRALARLVDASLEGHEAAAAPALIGSDDRDCGGVVHAIPNGLGAEPAEDHRVRCPDSSAGEHRHGQLRDHRHVDPDPVAPLDPELLERVGEAADPGEQLGVGDRSRVALLTLEVVGDLLALSGLDVAVQAVVGDVQLTTDEPLGEGKIPFEHRVERPVPADVLLRLLSPEALGVGGRGFEEALVGDPRFREELRARSERTPLVEQGVDGSGPLAHHDLLDGALTKLISAH